MKKILAVLLGLVAWMPMVGQSLPYPPPAVGGYWSTDGITWSSLTSTATTGGLAYPPPAAGLYGYNSSTGQWYPCSTTNPCAGAGGGGGGGTPGGSPFSIQYNNAGSFGGSTPCTGVGYFNTASAPACATSANILAGIGAGAITNSYLANSSTTVNGTSCALGGSCTVSDTRRNVIQTTGKFATLASNGTTNVFTVAAGNSGTITFLHLTMGITNIDLANVVQNTKIQVACDGNFVSIPLSLFFLSQDNPVNFGTDQIGVPLSNYNAGGTTTDYTFNRKVWINFTNGCTIALVNPSAAGSATIYFDTTYKVGTWSGQNPDRAHWDAFATAFLSVPQNTTQPWNYPQIALLPLNTYTGGGELESIAEYVNSANNYAYLEATPTGYIDGNLDVTANGGEDFFSCGYYCGLGTVSARTSKWGILIGSTGLQTLASAYDFVGYRFFTADPGDNVPFNSSLSVFTANGGNDYGAPGNVNINGLVTYFTTNPTASTVVFGSTPSNYYTSGSTLALTAYPSGASICYTTDGTTPTAPTAGTCSGGTTATYSAPITLTSTPTTITALATKAGYNNSIPIAQGTYAAETFTAPTYVGTCGNTPAGTSTGSVSCTLTTTAGDLIVQYCRGTAPSYVASSSPSNSFGNVGGFNAGFSGNGGEAFYALGTTGGSTTFTCTGTGFYEGITVLQYHPGSLTTFDNGIKNNILTTNLTFTSLNINTTAPQGLVVLCANSESGSTSFTSGTIGGTTANVRTATSAAQIGCEDLTNSTFKTGINGTLVTTPTSYWDGAIMAFK